jgi:hypothetical protein
VQLANNNPFGSVDDELTTTEHNGDIPEKHFLFKGLLAVESKPYL